ncbi:hypothetical protein COB11_08375 [Candidatus Aerophobetes bacterium]|uniref:Uncharacterized protein n=1 Tax=Aerophobetes bacterium TaxID=2030807 RepID=A0A2A4Y984_UNCAE|nr:MAG: hypothetical protein COB11_08375 [Candidatus Aerophobetes bacterium]
MANLTQAFNASSQRHRIQHPIIDTTSGTRVYTDPFNGRVITAEIPVGYDETHTLITGCCHKIFKDDELKNHLAPREVNDEGAFGDDRIGHNIDQACTCLKPLDVRDIDLSIRHNLSNEYNVHGKYHFTPLRVTTNPNGTLDLVNPYTLRVFTKVVDSITFDEYRKSADIENPNVATSRDGAVSYLDDNDNICLSRYKKIQNSSDIEDEIKSDKRLAITGCCHTITEIGSMRATHMTTCPNDRANLIGSEYGYQPTYFQNLNFFTPAAAPRDRLVACTNLIGLLAIWIGLEAQSAPITGVGIAVWGLSRVIHEVQHVSPALRTRLERVQRVAWKILDGIAAVAAGTLLAAAFLTSTPTTCIFTTIAITLAVYAAALGVTARAPIPNIPPLPAAVLPVAV